MSLALKTLFMLVLAPVAAMAQDWGGLATVSTTMGVSANRICVGEASRGDIGCPTYAPYVSANGNLATSGTITASSFVGDGSGLTGLSSSGDRITSGTTSVRATGTGLIQFSTSGTTTGYFDTSGLLVAPGISLTTANGISSTSGYFSHRVGIGTITPQSLLDISGTSTQLRLTDGDSAAYANFFAGDGSTAGIDPYMDINLLGGDSDKDHYIRFFRSTNTTGNVYLDFLRGNNTIDSGARISTNGGNSWFNYYGGNVGIGTRTPTAKLEVVGTVSATSFTGDGSGLTNISGDNLGNHTATQNVGLGSNAIVFGNTVSDKIYIYSNTYGIGIESSTLTNWSGSTFRWRIGGTSASTGSQQMLLNTTGLTVSGSVYINNDDSAAAPGYSWSSDTNTGMFWPAADLIGLSTGGTERLRVSSAGISMTGNIYLHDGGSIIGDNGDTTYSSALSLYGGGDSNSGGYINLYGSDASGANAGKVNIVAVSDTTTSVMHQFYRRTTAGASTSLMYLTGLGNLYVTGAANAPYFRAPDGDTAAAPGHAWQTDTNTGMFHPVADTIGWSLNGTERLRLTSTAISTTGNISLHDGGIIYGDNGDANYTGTLSLIAGADANTGSQVTLYGIDANGGGRIYMYATSDTTGTLLYRFHSRTTAGANSTMLSLYQGGDATLTGDMTAAAFLYSSDETLKKNIRTSPGLALVRNLQGHTFDWKATGKHASGVIAQEVEKVMPHVVKTGKEGTKVVDYPQLIAPLIEAVKDLDRENQALKTELQNQREEFNARLEKLEQSLRLQ